MAQIIVMKNWGPYHVYLKQQWSKYNEQRKISINPYKQYELDMCKTLLAKLEKEYRDYLGAIGSDNGAGFNVYMENEGREIRTKLENATDVYMQSAYKGAANVLKGVIKVFKVFIKMDQEKFRKEYLLLKEE